MLLSSRLSERVEALAALAQAGPAPPPKSCCECRSEDEVTESIEFNFRDGKEGEQEIEEFHSEGGIKGSCGLFVLQIKDEEEPSGGLGRGGT